MLRSEAEMAIPELNEDQIRSWSVQEKDQWWLDNVYRGDMPQLTLRSGLTGMALGAVLSLTNLYIGINTGWTLGVGITSVVLSFALFKVLSKLKLGSEITLLENNAMQSIATSAGYMTGPLVSSITAYMLVSQKVIPMYQTMSWMIVLSILGVLVAFPLKRRFINDEQMPFPEGRAAGTVLYDLHNNGDQDASLKTRILVKWAGISALIECLRDEGLMSFLGLTKLSIPEYWDSLVYNVYVPRIMGSPLKDLSVNIESSIVMVAAGGLIGLKTGISLFIGACLNYLVLAPVMIDRGIIEGVGFKNITMWSLWGGVAMMTTASLFSFLSKPGIIISSVKGLFSRAPSTADVLGSIELPLQVSLIGIPILGLLAVAMGHFFFGVGYLMGLVAIPLTFVFTVIAVNSTGLTSITPVGALGKLTQLSFSVLAPGNPTTNIMTAGITAEVASNASNLLMDIKPGYMLGGKPRHQAAGHVLGIFAGALVAIPVFYVLFNGNLSILASEQFPMPAAQVWAAVAKVLTKGLGFLHPTAIVSIVIGGLLGIAFEIANIKMKGRFPLSGVGMGLAFVMPFSTSLAIFLGAGIFWLIRRVSKNPENRIHRNYVENKDSVCAGAIAGGSIFGILLIIIDQALFS
jgi:uncharacterized oligopeptide transporter (OPT) family protein